MSRPESNREGFEPTDVGGPQVLLLVGAAVVVVLVTVAILAGLAWILPPEEAPSVAPPPPLTRGAGPSASMGRDASRQPLLELRRQERALLEQWEWLDGSGGTARIPVERAAEILAEDPEFLQRAFGPDGILAAPAPSTAPAESAP